MRIKNVRRLFKELSFERLTIHATDPSLQDSLSELKDVEKGCLELRGANGMTLSRCLQDAIEIEQEQ
jgi:hypothetical protein